MHEASSENKPILPNCHHNSQYLYLDMSRNKMFQVIKVRWGALTCHTNIPFHI